MLVVDGIVDDMIDCLLVVDSFDGRIVSAYHVGTVSFCNER